jgi:phosphoribosyl-dephospho-CoA transferase
MLRAEVAHVAARRHDLVWVDPCCLRQHLHGEIAPSERALVQEWFEHGRPAVVRRSEAHTPDGMINLGIPLSPQRGRLRIALTLAAKVVRDIQPPLLLTRVTPHAPATWQAPLRYLAAAAEAMQLPLRVYGSLLWQHLTGEPYVTERSDVDLLFRVRDAFHLRSAMTLLLQWERETGLRADGELLLADGSGVAWRELLHGDGPVLVKRIAAADLLARADVLQNPSRSAT